jgi:hypothetical protein
MSYIIYSLEKCSQIWNLQDCVFNVAIASLKRTGDQFCFAFLWIWILVKFEDSLYNFLEVSLTSV